MWALPPISKSEVLDLNEVRLRFDRHDASAETCEKFYADPTILGDDCSVIFRKLKVHLIHLIRQFDYVYGCVAWLTDFDVLDALAEKKGVALVVQKEDFLRPDGPGSNQTWKQDLRRRYLALRGVFRPEMPGLVGKLSVLREPDDQGVRCAGTARGRRGDRYDPLMHHKFALFALEPGRADREDVQYPMPSAVWSGSFNWSANASRSFENAVVTTRPELVAAYYQEFSQVFSMSEPLDWESEYVDPEYRIGT